MKYKKILVVNDIAKLINIENEREQFDYCLEDITEAVSNNEFLVMNLKDNRIYEVTEEEYRKCE